MLGFVNRPKPLKKLLNELSNSSMKIVNPASFPESDLVVVVAQNGARHRYAVPRIFYRANMLGFVFTDSHSSSLFGRLVRQLKSFNLSPKACFGLEGRDLSSIPPEFVRSSDIWTIARIILGRLFHENSAPYIYIRDKVLGAIFPKRELSKADVLYVMEGENLFLQRFARKRGLQIVLECYIHPMCYLQIANEKRRHSLQISSAENAFLRYQSHCSRCFEHADIILCPSTWVADGVKELSPEQAHKIRICPYGSSLPPSGVSRAPVPGRIFWAGGDWFRKGLHHLAAAADLALKQEPEMEFRIAGITDPLVISKPEFRNLRFLGKLDKTAMQEEFAKADLFVLPTLTEGMASVLVEAITAGCPVLTTRGAGFDGLEESGAGRIFEAADASGLASHLVELTRDRAAIGAMNEACTRFAPNFTEDAWARRLIPVLKELADRKPKS